MYLLLNTQEDVAFCTKDEFSDSTQEETFRINISSSIFRKFCNMKSSQHFNIITCTISSSLGVSAVSGELLVGSTL